MPRPSPTPPVPLRFAVPARAGPGPPRRRIFEPYYRLRKNHDHRAGTGLGLAISRGYVEAHGGKLHVEPTPGGGATFVVELPIAA